MLTIVASAILGGIGGALGWWIAGLISPDGERPKWLPAVCALLLVLIGRNHVAAWLAPIAGSLLADAGDAESFYAALRDEEPALYAQVRTILDSNVAKDDPESARAQIHAVITPQLMAKIPYTSRQNLVDFAELFSEQARYLSAHRPDLCAAFIRGDDIRFDRILSPDLVAREYALYTALVTAPRQPDAPRSSADEIARTIELIMPAVSDELAVSEPAMLAALEQRGPGHMICMIPAGMFEQVLQLSPDHSERVLRTLSTDL